MQLSSQFYSSIHSVFLTEYMQKKDPEILKKIHFLLKDHFYFSHLVKPIEELQPLRNLEKALIHTAGVSPNTPLVRYIQDISGSNATLGAFASFPDVIILHLASFLRRKERDCLASVNKAMRKILYYPDILHFERTLPKEGSPKLVVILRP